MLGATTGKMMQREAKTLQTSAASHSACYSGAMLVQLWRQINVRCAMMLVKVQVSERVKHGYEDKQKRRILFSVHLNCTPNPKESTRIIFKSLAFIII